MYGKYVKRVLDVFMAMMLGVITLPISLAVAIAIKLESRGPVLFVQERSGEGGKPFRLLKFRSMASYNNVHDKRSKDVVTRVGKIIRKLLLDELPQLINVLKGEMSFIGPRPWLTEYFMYMDDKQRRRYDVLPGITGLAQAVGRNNLTIDEKIAYDLSYVKNLSFLEDIRVVLMTLKTLTNHTSVDIGKSGIHDELDYLKKHLDSKHKHTKKVLFSATVDSHILAFHVPFLKYFKDQGYEVHVASTGHEKIPFCDKKINVDFARNPFHPKNYKVAKKLKKVMAKERYDIVHTHMPVGSVVTRLAARYSRKHFGTKVIYTAHGFHFYKGAPLRNWFMYYPIEKILSKYTDSIITINKEDYNLVAHKFKTNVHYVPGVGIDESRFKNLSSSDKISLRKSLGLNKDDFLITFPAELNRNKNQKLLIEAMDEIVDRYPNVHLLLPGKDSLSGYYQKMTKEKDLNRHIHFLGHRKDITDILQISNLSVSSSYREGLPLNIMEAMFVGLPIIATNCRGNRDLVKQDINGFVIEPDDVKEFIHKFERLYKDSKLLETFSRKNIELAKDYLLPNIMNHMQEVYEEIV